MHVGMFGPQAIQLTGVLLHILWKTSNADPPSSAYVAGCPMDDPQLHGLWKIQSRVQLGEAAHSPASHYHFQQGMVRQFFPDLVDDPAQTTSYDVMSAEGEGPRRLLIRHVYDAPELLPEPEVTLQYALYQVRDEELVVAINVNDEFPVTLDCQTGIVVTLVRDHGPMPAVKQPSGTPPIADDIIGGLRWNDEYNWYERNLNIKGNRVHLTLDPEQPTEFKVPLERARQIVANIERYCQLAADVAVQELLKLKNDFWLSDGEAPVSADEFKGLMDLTSIAVGANGDTTFWHDDGDLFAGHSIEVCIDLNDSCIHADIPG